VGKQEPVDRTVRRDELTTPVATAADSHLEGERTRMGPRFVGDEFETPVYRVDGGVYYQTTFAYWRHRDRDLAVHRARISSMWSTTTRNPRGTVSTCP